MRFVIHKRVDAAANPPIVRYWFTVVDAQGEPLAAGDKDQVIAAIDLIRYAQRFPVEDFTGEN